MALIFFCDDFSKSISSNFSYISVINVSENTDSAFLKIRSIASMSQRGKNDG